MRYSFLGRATVYVLFSTLFLGGCGEDSVTPAGSNGSSGTPVSAATIQKFVDDGWLSVTKGRADFRGSLVMHIESAAGNYTVSSGDSIADPENSFFRPASNTKVFTAAAIMLLAQEGRLNIDDPVSANIPGTQSPYLPATPDYQIPNRNTITIRQLLGHRAGVFDVSNNNIPATAAQPYAGMRYADYVRQQPGNDGHTFTFDEIAGVVSVNQLSDFPPGQQFHYSNEGYSLLGKIIEQVSGMRYHQFLQQRFFAPNLMPNTRTAFQGTDQNLDSPFVPGFTYLPPPDGNLNTTIDNMSINVAEGNLITTPHELAAWYRSLFTGGLELRPAAVAQMMNVQPTGDRHLFYGLGITYTPGLGYGHDGAHVGYLSTCRYDPTTGTLVVIFASNLDATDIGAEGEALFKVAAQAKGALEGRTIDLPAPTGTAPSLNGD